MSGIKLYSNSNYGSAGTLVFSISLADLLNGDMGLGMGSRLALVGSGQAELFSLDLMSAYTFRFAPAACG
jgi:hypothetical protein